MAERTICVFNPGGTYCNHWACKGCGNTKIPSYCFSPQDISVCVGVCCGYGPISLSIVRLNHSMRCGCCSAASSPYQPVYDPTVSILLLRSPLFEHSLRQPLTTPYLRFILVLSSLTLSVQKICNSISRIYHASSHPSLQTLFFIQSPHDTSFIDS